MNTPSNILQRNHTLFGSVWSSIRRKGTGPVGRGVPKTTAAAASDTLTVPYGRNLTNGIDHVAQTIMLQTPQSENIQMRPLVLNGQQQPSDGYE